MGFWNLKDCEFTEVIRSDQKPNGGTGDQKRGARGLAIAAAADGRGPAMQLLASPAVKLASASSGRFLRPKELQLR